VCSYLFDLLLEVDYLMLTLELFLNSFVFELLKSFFVVSHPTLQSLLSLYDISNIIVDFLLAFDLFFPLQFLLFPQKLELLTNGLYFLCLQADSLIKLSVTFLDDSVHLILLILE
jgi:hypothetical protein